MVSLTLGPNKAGTWLGNQSHSERLGIKVSASYKITGAGSNIGH